jgi:hypothetical protein
MSMVPFVTSPLPLPNTSTRALLRVAACHWIRPPAPPLRPGLAINVAVAGSAAPPMLTTPRLWLVSTAPLAVKTAAPALAKPNTETRLFRLKPVAVPLTVKVALPAATPLCAIDTLAAALSPPFRMKVPLPPRESLMKSTIAARFSVNVALSAVVPLLKVTLISVQVNEALPALADPLKTRSGCPTPNVRPIT